MMLTYITIADSQTHDKSVCSLSKFRLYGWYFLFICFLLLLDNGKKESGQKVLQVFYTVWLLNQDKRAISVSH